MPIQDPVIVANTSITTPTISVPCVFSGTSSITLPIGTTAQRPSAAQGMIRFNSDIGEAEWYDSAASAWKPMSQSYAQVWTDVTGSRSSGVTYTNSTGRIIQVIATVQQAGSYVYDWTVTVAGTTISRLYIATNGQQTQAYTPITFNVPINATYVITITQGPFQRWLELR